MTKCKTCFDRIFRKEEISFLSEEIIDKQREESRMLLRTYNTEIFDPKQEELPSVTKSEFNKFINRTANIRRKKDQKIILSFQYKYLMACAASLAIVCCMYFFFTSNNKYFAPENISDNPLNTDVFRGQNGNMPIYQTLSGDAQSSSAVENNVEPLAYLVDTNGNVIIKRGASFRTVNTSCEILNKGDIVSLEGESTVKIMYEDAFFDLAGPSEYQIARSSPLKMGVGNSRQIIEPSFTVRGAGYVDPANTLVIAPKSLIGMIDVPVTRTTGEYIEVFSPRGATFSHTPSITIGGDDNNTYVISVLDFTGDVCGRPMQIMGHSSIAWNEITDEPLHQDEMYSIIVTSNGKIVNDANNAFFWLISSAESERISDVIKHVAEIESTEARCFFNANALYMNGCYAEAREIALKLEQKNQIYANFVKLCNNALGVK